MNMDETRFLIDMDNNVSLQKRGTKGSKNPVEFVHGSERIISGRIRGLLHLSLSSKTRTEAILFKVLT